MSNLQIFSTINNLNLLIMICFPNAKINIGLNIVSKRADTYHNLETVFYPIPLTDILEFVAEKNISETIIQVSGSNLNISSKENICIKAYNLLSENYSLPPIEMYLHKIIPSGAGLGGGSADAAFLLKELNSYFSLSISNDKLLEYAAQLGADCPFFIENKAVFASGTGSVFENITLDLSAYYIVVVKPEFSISTAQAFKNITPKTPVVSIKELIKMPVSEWKTNIVNDFEDALFPLHPELLEIKNTLYNLGALYASMSGSGSALYGIFKEKIDISQHFKNVFYWHEKLN